MWLLMSFWSPDDRFIPDCRRWTGFVHQLAVHTGCLSWLLVEAEVRQQCADSVLPHPVA